MREQEHRRVDPDLLDARDVRRVERHERAQRAVREQQPERAAATASRRSRRAAARRASARVAPSAVRIAISRARAAARASSRFAMFAHAMSSTSATAPSSTSSAGRIVCAAFRPSSARVLKVQSARIVRRGSPSSAARPRRSCPACACSTVTLGFSRAIILRNSFVRRSSPNCSGLKASGAHRSAGRMKKSWNAAASRRSPRTARR